MRGGRRPIGYRVKPFRVNKRLFLALLAVSALLFLAFLLYQTARSNQSALTGTGGKSSSSAAVIIIDAGHGGIDGGAVGADGTVEKDLNLAIALHLDEFLSTFGFQTILVRKDDNSIHSEEAKTIRQQKVSDIHNRTKLVNETKNAVLLSIHQNKFTGSSVHGTQVFYSPNNAKSQQLAQGIQDSVAQLLQPENKKIVKKAGTSIYLLYNAQAPAALVECGFLSNTAERELLRTPDYQSKMAFVITCGLLNYFGQDEKPIL